ncbi:TIGR02186 family protein [Jannaschia sp. LMIT008]|uniref:TIGR02186 family protein n=1 Tax=Jannaschia maritima TaxID=3032585 RepID=UPI002810B72B|nr:TIGR02186 family protein [Jannaschia sp. LMIT008]
MIRVLALLILAWATPASAERVVAALSQNRVQIDTAFTGSEILVYGAIVRDLPAPDDSKLGVIVTVSGPEVPTTVRRKERRLGIWVNTDAAVIERAPSFYAVAASAPIAQILLGSEDERYFISPGRALRGVMAAEGLNADKFTEALIRIREREGAFQTSDSPLFLTDDTLFSTEVRLPANLVEGTYAIRIFLTRDGVVRTRYDTVISVRKVGLERFLYNLAHEQPLIYGLMSLGIAIFAGWAASAVFRFIKA